MSRLPGNEDKEGLNAMLWLIASVLILLWLLGFFFNVAGSLIHLLLVAALIVFVVNLLRGRTTV